MFKEDLLEELKNILIDRKLSDLDDNEIIKKDSLFDVLCIFENISFEDLGVDIDESIISNFINDLRLYCEDSSKNNEENIISSKDELLQFLEEDATENDYENTDANIFLDKTGMSIKELNDKYDEKDIIIPEFQRKSVWSKSKICNFIDSLHKGYPIPPIFVYEDINSGVLEVIDGYQRLKSINLFMSGDKKSKNKNKLKLRYGKSSSNFLHGKTFDDLSTEEQRKFKNKSIMVFKITPLSKEKDKVNHLKLQIFNKLNTGGENLNRMEARRALSYSDSSANNIIKNLEEVVNGDYWQKVCGINNKRYKSLEFLLRLYVFSKTIDIYGRKIFYKKNNEEIKFSDIPNFLDKYLMDNKDNFDLSFKPKINSILKDLASLELDLSYGKGNKVNYLILDSFLLGLLLCGKYDKNLLKNKLFLLKEIKNRDGKESIPKYFDDKSGTMLLDSIIYRVSESIKILEED